MESKILKFLNKKRAFLKNKFHQKFNKYPPFFLFTHSINVRNPMTFSVYSAMKWVYKAK